MLIQKCKNIIFRFLNSIYYLFNIIIGSLHGYIKKLSIIGLYEYSDKNNCIKKIIENSEIRNFQSCENDVNTKSLPVSKVYFTLLNDVYVLSDTDALCTDKLFIYDRADWDKESMLRFKSDFITKFYENYAYVYINKKKIKYVEKGISLVKMWSSNIFHLTFEVLARLSDIDSLSEYDSWPLLIDDCVLHDERSMDLLRILNRKKREIIFVNKSNPLKVKELLIPPRYAWASWNQKIWNLGCTWYIEKKALHFIKESVLSIVEKNKEHKKIFVVRGNDDRLTNESRLQELFLKHGFEIFNPDKASFSEEVEYFSTAEVIVTCAGGALTNLVYCQSSATVYVIIPPKHKSVFVFYRDFGINLQWLDAEFEKTGRTLNTSSFHLNPNQLDIVFKDF